MTNTEAPADSGPPPVEPQVFPEASVPRPMRFPVLAAIVAVLLGCAGIWIWTEVTPTPEAVVEEFFDAIVDKDIDRALDQVAGKSGAIPHGEKATFIAPEAVAGGWRLLDTEQDAGSNTIDVTIGNAETKTMGSVTITDVDGEPKLVDPFITVKFTATALTYLSVNDMTVGIEDLHTHDPTNQVFARMKLLPGLNRFFGGLKGSTGKAPDEKLMLPAGDDDDPVEVPVPKLKFTDAADADLQEDMEKIIDECAELTVPQPRLCPFGVDTLSIGETYFGDIYDVAWKVEKYPRVSLGKQAGDEMFDAGIHLDLDEPGSITLTATGRADTGETELTLDCEFATEPVRAALTPDGTPRVTVLPGEIGFTPNDFDLNTCDGVDDEEQA
ncbi:MAG: hypothetical protein ACRD0P_00840 [Stackebrandtia sp.]